MGFLAMVDKKSFEVKYDQYRNRKDGRRSRTKPQQQRLEAIRLDGHRSCLVGVRVLSSSVHSRRSQQAQEIS